MSPPDLAVLDRRYGGYWKIPPAAMRTYWKALADWRLERGMGSGGYDRGNQVVFTKRHWDMRSQV